MTRASSLPMYKMLIRVGDCGFDFLELQGYCLLALLACLQDRGCSKHGYKGVLISASVY